MWTSRPPRVSASEIARACVRNIRKNELRSALLAALDTIDANSLDYRVLGDADRLHEIDANSHPVAGVTDDQFRWLYSSRLVKNKDARRLYDLLLASAPYDLCLYCKDTVAATLDHFVPKHMVGSFAIEPNNLIPACPRCNTLIGEEWSSSRARQMLHPFFLGDLGRWLRAKVEQGSPPVVTFMADPDPSLPEPLKDRIVQQFHRLDLGLRLAKSSASELSGLCRKLSAGTETPAEVRSLLDNMADVGFQADPNDRRGAMFEALASSAWFCEGGYAS